MEVGYRNNNYPYQRNIIDKVEGYKYKQVNDFYRYSTKVFKSLKKMRLFKNQSLIINHEFSFNDFNVNKVNVLHFFNNVSYGKTPWVSTFETFIPRFGNLLSSHEIKYDKKVMKALKAIESNHCKQLIALSENAKLFQRHLINHYPEFKGILEKITVIHPPQDLLVENFEQKNLSIENEIKFIFIGSHFFRKGGLEIIEAFNYLRNDKKLPIKLTIVSSMVFNDYATHSTEDQRDLVIDFIDKNKNWITHFNQIPNNKVLELIKDHHIGLLPTWADTYGYSVLEFQASGCPVISTDIRALPEINNDEIGWIIKVPKNPLGEANYQTETERIELSNIIKNQLINTVAEIFSNKSVIPEKSKKSIENIQTKHNPIDYQSKLKKIYETY